jgi:hypothetical protein
MRGDIQVESSADTVDSIGPQDNGATDSGRERLLLVLPLSSSILILSCGVMWLLCDTASCSQQLFLWDIFYVTCHLAKWILSEMKTQSYPDGREVPPRLVLASAIVDFAFPSLWSLGGYFVFNTESCSTTLYVYTLVLWFTQTLTILLPCCFLSTIIFCAPVIIRVVPYFIRPNPNTIAASDQVLSRFEKKRFSEYTVNTSSTSCSICLGDYSPEDIVMKLPCGHIFHATCIETWLSLSQLCPVDRRNVSELVDIV